MGCLLEYVIVLNYLCMRWLQKFISVVFHLCVYNNNLHSLVRNTVHCTALVLFFISKIHCICQKYLPLEHDFESEEVHYSPFVEEVKHLSNPLILRFSFEKSLKSTDFCLFWFLFWIGKDNLHYSVWLRFLLRFF